MIRPRLFLTLLVAIHAGLVDPTWAAPKKPEKTAEALPKFKSSSGPTELRSVDTESASGEAQRIAKRGMAAFGKGDLAAAKKDFLQVLKIAPDNVATTINLGLIAHRERDFMAAERWLTQAVRKQPDAGLAWLLLGIVAYDQDKLDEALAALAQAVLHEPKDARAHHYLGVTIGRKGWYSGAEDEMRKAIELSPDYAEAHFNLAVFYLERSPPAVELARRHYRKSLELGSPPDVQVEKAIEQGPSAPAS